MPIDHGEFRIVKTFDKAFVSTDAGPDTPVTLERCFVKSWSTSGDADDRPTESLAVDPNNPNGDLTPGPDDNVAGVPAVQTDDGLLLPAVQDDGLLLPAVQTGGVSVASGDVNGDTDALGDPVTFTFTVEPSLSLFNAFMTIEIPDSGVRSAHTGGANALMGDGSVRFLHADAGHLNPSSFQIISAGKGEAEHVSYQGWAHFEQSSTPLFSEDDTFDFSQLTTEPTAPAGPGAPGGHVKVFCNYDPIVQMDDGLLLPAVQTDDAEVFTAIALAESGVNSEPHAPHGEDSLGLWQINVDPAQPDVDTFDCSELTQWASGTAREGGVPKGDGITDVTFETLETGAHALYQDVVIPTPDTGEGFWLV